MNKYLLEKMEDKTPTFLNGNGGKRQGRGLFGLLLMAFFALFLSGKAWAQTDYSGVYYIASGGKGPQNGAVAIPIIQVTLKITTIYAPLKDGVITHLSMTILALIMGNRSLPLTNAEMVYMMQPRLCGP